MARKPKGPKQVAAITHDWASRRNIPTMERQSARERVEETHPLEPLIYGRADPLTQEQTRDRDTDLDPQLVWKGTSLRLTQAQIEALKAGKAVELGDAQLVWRGKDQQDWSDLVVRIPPIYVQEKIHPQAIIADLQRRTGQRRQQETQAPDLFADFNGLDPQARSEFYQHDQNWQNRMILGDSLYVMASLAGREDLRGQVQCIYVDPPYGIKFNSNWQVSTRSRDVRDGKRDHITREPEQVWAFRDTWKDGIHSYLTYLRDRFTVMRDLLTDSGSIFVQIGDENMHRVRALMDEVFGEENFVAEIVFTKTSTLGTKLLPMRCDYILWFARNKESVKYRSLFVDKPVGKGTAYHYFQKQDGQAQSISESSNLSDKEIKSGSFFVLGNLLSTGFTKTCYYDFPFDGRNIAQGRYSWKTTKDGMDRLRNANRIWGSGTRPGYIQRFDDFPVKTLDHLWTDVAGAQDRKYVVETTSKVIQRCILMTTDPGDLVLDPTCGSGTTAYVAEQWGRRWITVDTSRVALALARTRLMSARYPWYYLADSAEGRAREQDISGRIQPDTPTHNDTRQGFVYERVPHIMLSTISNNAEIDVIWEDKQPAVEQARRALNQALINHPEPFTIESGGRKGQTIDFTARGEVELPSGETAPANGFMEWEIPRQAPERWPQPARDTLAAFWQARINRQREIDRSIAQKADVEYLYDRPYEDKSKVRVTGPFTVESLSPHRMIPAYAGDAAGPAEPGQDFVNQDFVNMVLENLKSAGVHQSDRAGRLSFTAMDGWPGDYICAGGTYEQDDRAGRAAIFIGPEFGSVTRADIEAAAREAHAAGFDLLIACGFNFDAHSSDISRLGPLPILKARINPDLHMAADLMNTGTGNLFVVFGEPDIRWDFDADGRIVVEVLGVDVFEPKTGQVRASGKGDIAAWFIDTDYDGESFFVRHAGFMGANDPYKSLKTSLKAEIDEEAWATLYRDKSRPFARPSTGRFAVKVINHFGDEVMKVFRV